MFLTGVKTIFGIVASLILTASNVASKRLDVIDLPDGFVSGGITNGEGWTAYVGSVAGENMHVNKYIYTITAVALPSLFREFSRTVSLS